jgi:hypothetical protein
MPNDPIAEFLTPDCNDTVPAQVLLTRIVEDYIELAKLRNEYEKKIQMPDLQKAYKAILEHKGFLLSQLMVQFYMSSMKAITELEYVNVDTELEVKLKYSPLP